MNWMNLIECEYIWKNSKELEKHEWIGTGLNVLEFTWVILDVSPARLFVHGNKSDLCSTIFCAVLFCAESFGSQKWFVRYK